MNGLASQADVSIADNAKAMQKQVIPYPVSARPDAKRERYFDGEHDDLDVAVSQLRAVKHAEN